MHRLAFALALVAWLDIPSDALAQIGSRTADFPLVVEREVHERWIQGGQHPGFVPFSSTSESLRIRARSGPGTGESRSLDVGGRNWEGSLRLDPRNRLLSVRVDAPSLSVRRSVDPGQVDGWMRFLEGVRNRVAGLWELPVVLPPEPLVAGVTWTDTLSFSADPGNSWRETLDGVWTYEVVGDTIVDGRQLPVVRLRA